MKLIIYRLLSCSKCGWYSSLKCIKRLLTESKNIKELVWIFFADEKIDQPTKPLSIVVSDMSNVVIILTKFRTIQRYRSSSFFRLQRYSSCHKHKSERIRTLNFEASLITKNIYITMDTLLEESNLAFIGTEEDRKTKQVRNKSCQTKYQKRRKQETRTQN